MAKKKKKPQVYALKRVPRLRKARQWLAKYDGGTDNIVSHYRSEFRVDVATALRDLQEIGHAFEPDYIETALYKEERRIHSKQMQKQKQSENDVDWRDDRFYFIAGYTSGGAPYGVTWEEMNMEPYEDEYGFMDDDDDD